VIRSEGARHHPKRNGERKDPNLDTLDSIEKLMKGIQYLLEGLEELGLIDTAALFDRGISATVVKIRYSKRLDYEEVAKWLKEGYPVFIPIDKRRAYYAQKRLSEILNEEVKKKPAMWEDGEKGYIFFF